MYVFYLIYDTLSATSPQTKKNGPSKIYYDAKPPPQCHNLVIGEMAKLRVNFPPVLAIRKIGATSESRTSGTSKSNFRKRKVHVRSSRLSNSVQLTAAHFEASTASQCPFLTAPIGGNRLAQWAATVVRSEAVGHSHAREYEWAYGHIRRLSFTGRPVLCGPLPQSSECPQSEFS